MDHKNGLSASAIAHALTGATSAAALAAGAAAGPAETAAAPVTPAAAAPVTPAVPVTPTAAAVDAEAIRADAIKAERTRVAGINALPVAAARPAAVAHAIESGMSVESATAFLAKMPEESAGGRETLGSRMDSVTHPPRPGADTGRKPGDHAAVAIDAAAIFRDRAKAQNLPH